MQYRIINAVKEFQSGFGAKKVGRKGRKWPALLECSCVTLIICPAIVGGDCSFVKSCWLQVGRERFVSRRGEK